MIETLNEYEPDTESPSEKFGRLYDRVISTPGLAVSDCVRLLLEQWLDAGFESAQEINCGNCGDFASELAILLEGAQVRWGDDYGNWESGWPYSVGHAFVEYRGRYYDSEAPDGVEQWYDLPIYTRAKERGE